MLTLLTFKPGLGVSSPSPFAVKADALLAMSGLPYEKEFGDVRKAPRGKFPVLGDGDTLVPDTAHIQAYLENQKGIDFDSHLTSQQLAVATAFRRLIEHHFYFINAHFRWTDHGSAIKETYFEDVPNLMRGFVFGMVRKSLFKSLHMQGLGRHSREELIEFGRQDVEAIAGQLGTSDYFLGDKPSSIDASLYGALHNLIDCELDGPIEQFCMTHQNLIDYCARFKAEILDLGETKQ